MANLLVVSLSILQCIVSIENGLQKLFFMFIFSYNIFSNLGFCTRKTPDPISRKESREEHELFYVCDAQSSPNLLKRLFTIQKEEQFLHKKAK